MGNWVVALTQLPIYAIIYMGTINGRLCLILFIGVLFSSCLVACNNNPEETGPTAIVTATSQPRATQAEQATATAQATGTATPQPTATATASQVPTETAAATDTPGSTPVAPETSTDLAIGDEVYEVEGQFTFQTIADFLVGLQPNQAGINSEDGEILLFMAIRATDETDDLQSVLEEFIAATSADAGALESGESYPIVIDGGEGLAIDVSGEFLGEEMDGRVATIAPDDSRIFLVYGLAVNGRWADEGSVVFEETVGTVAFSEQTAIAPTATAEAVSDFPLPIPSGEPATEWKGIPIMSQAIAGVDNNDSYAFTVATTTEAVQHFYEEAMEREGWSSLGLGEGAEGSLLLIFQREAEVATVSIFTLESGNLYVFLVK